MLFKLVTFDFTGTLMRFRVLPPLQYVEVAKMYGFEIPDRQIFSQKFRSAFQTVEKEHPNFGASTNLPWTQWWLKVAKLSYTNAGVPDNPKLTSAAWHLIKLYSTTQGWEVIPGIFQ